MLNKRQAQSTILLLLMTLTCCTALPGNVNRQDSYALQDTETTFLGQLFKRQSPEHPGKSGVLLLVNGLDAFVARALLAEKAERSIDVQYYMFHQDTVGQMLINSLIKAADRGVRVRMLIDDMYGDEADDIWTALDSHPHMEVRLFNPFARGSSKNLQFITRFSEVNHRMHSKSFTVDNQATIVGGRNIGDEYFDADQDLAFADIDVLATGPVVDGVSDAFDQYWNSRYAYSASLLAGQATSDALAAVKRHLEGFQGTEPAQRYLAALNDSNLANSLRAGTTTFDWAEAQVIHDPWEKQERGENWQEELLISQLWPFMKAAEDELLIVSPYFIPGRKGAEALCELSNNGVRIRILTNSLASNDVSAVHAGYSRYRKQLLEAGVELYELDEEIKKEVLKRFTWLPGLSKSSLHAKTMVLDQRAMFVGSMNLDPRSLQINNEIGILFSNQKVAGLSALTFSENINKVAFKVELGPNGSLLWKVERDGEEFVYPDEPYVTFWNKLTVWFIRLLPVEWLL
jgi:putative cardiolipin synthase